MNVTEYLINYSTLKLIARLSKIDQKSIVPLPPLKPGRASSRLIISHHNSDIIDCGIKIHSLHTCRKIIRWQTWCRSPSQMLSHYASVLSFRSIKEEQECIRVSRACSHTSPVITCHKNPSSLLFDDMTASEVVTPLVVHLCPDLLSHRLESDPDDEHFH